MIFLKLFLSAQIPNGSAYAIMFVCVEVLWPSQPMGLRNKKNVSIFLNEKKTLLFTLPGKNFIRLQFENFFLFFSENRL